MGNYVSKKCKDCPSPATSSVVNLSDNLVIRLTEGPENVPEEEEHIGGSIEEQEWIQRLNCIDEQHSQAYGLSLEGFDKMMANVERRIALLGSKSPCAILDVIECYKENPNCSLKCKREVDHFIDCVDLNRLKALRKKYDEEKLR